MVDAQKKIERLRNSLAKTFYFALKLGVSLGLGYFTAQSSLLNELSPFSIILLTCSPNIGLVASGCYIGSTFGYLIQPFDLHLFKYITALTMIYVIYMVFGRSLRILRGDMAVTSAACCFVSGVLFLLIGQLTLFNVLLLTAESLLICCSIFFVSYAIRGFKKNCFLTSRELIAAAVTFILIMISLHNVHIFEMSTARILGLLIIFAAIHCLKTSHTAVLGSCIGIILAAVANGGDAIFTAIVVGTLMGCVFSNFSERFAELSVLIVYYAVLIFFGKFPWNYWLFAEPIAAYGIAFFVPKEKLRLFLSSYITVRTWKKGKKYKENIGKIITGCEEECANFCPKSATCYQKNKELLIEGLEEMAERYDQTKELGDIEAFLPFCIKPKTMQGIILRQFLLENSEDFNELTLQLDEISKRIEEKINASAFTVKFLNEEENKISKALEKRKIDVKEINFIVDEHQMKRCEIEFLCTKDLLYDQILNHILSPFFPNGLNLNLKMNDGIGFARATESNRYRIQCAAICKTKDGEERCGDKAFGFSIGNGIYYLLLADGMGSGMGAAYQSEIAIDTLKKLLMGGVSVRNAVNILRSAMRFRYNDGFSTLDICKIDLNQATAEFYKAGAYDSFCLNDKKIIKIDGGGMPPGLTNRGGLNHSTIKFASEASIIMASDGLSVLEEYMPEILMEASDHNPKFHAKNLHKKIAEIALGVNDDITIIVAKLNQIRE